MFASLPMYDFAEVSAATEAFWQALREEILLRMSDIDLAQARMPTDRINDLYDHWQAPDLLISQTCGFPLTHALRGKVRYVATPIYAAPGCGDKGDYCSMLLVREDSSIGNFADVAGKRFAFNGRDSQSGYNAMSWMTMAQADDTPDTFFGEEIQSGSHRQSLAMVAEGHADICAVDCVSYALIAKYAPVETANLRILGQTPKAPALPFITSLKTSDTMLQELRSSLASVVMRPDLRNVLNTLFLKNFSVRPLQSYDLICDTKVAKTTF